MNPNHRSLPARRLATVGICAVFLLQSTASMTAAGSLADREWLPEAGRQQLAAQLTEGFRLIDDGSKPASDEEWSQRGRRALDSMARRIEQLGVATLIERQPRFENVNLPATENRFADAIAAWGACSLPLHRELATDARQEFYVLLGEVQVVLVSAALRQGMLDAGGSDEQLAALLRTQTMNEVSYEIQQREDLRAHVNERCGPVLGMLLEPPSEESSDSSE